MAEDETIETPEGAEREEAQAAPRRRLRASRVGRWAVFVLGGIVLLIGAALLLLDTAPGHRFVVDQVRALEFENGMEIEVGEIDGSIYGEMVLKDLSIRDPKGEFLFSPEVQVDWSPFRFISNHLQVRSATAETMILRRVPEFNETESEGPLLPDLDIDIERLRIARFIAEAPVSGTERIATIAGKAHISDGRAQVDLDAGTLAGGETQGGDTIKLKLDAVPEENRLAVDAQVQAPQGGVIAALAGLTRPLSLDLEGSGKWEAWNGRLNADYGTSQLARLDVRARDGTVSVRGPVRPAGFLEGAALQLLGPTTNVDIAATLEERAATLAGSLSNESYRLNTNGIVDLSDNTFDGLKLAFTLLRPSAIADNLGGSGLRAMLTLDGAFATPNVEYAINANRVVMNDLGLENFSARGAANVDADRILIPVDARASRITGLDTVAGGTLTNVRLDGDVAIAGTRVLSDNMRIRSDRIDANAVLLANLDTGLYTGAIDGRIDNYRLESVGILNIETDVDLESNPSGYALAGTVRARSTSLSNSSLQQYLGGNFVASSDVRYGDDGTARFANLRLESPLLRIVSGEGSYTQDGRIALVADARSQQYGAVNVRVAGTLDNPDARIRADNPDFGIGLANVDARIRGARGGYRLDVTGDTDYGPLTADVTLGLQGATSIQINSANLAGVDFAGSLRQTRAGPFAGQLTANGNGIGGIVDLGSEGRYQAATFNLRAKDASFPGAAGLYIGSAIADGRAVLYDTPQVVADVQLADTRYGAFDINAARALVDYRGGRGKAKALIEGRSGAPFRVALNAAMTPELWRVALDGKARGIGFKTASPARILPKSGSYELLPTRIDLGTGNLKLAGTYGTGMKLQSRLEGVDLSIANAFVPGLGLGGRASGSFDFVQSSSSAFPRADARLKIDNLTRTSAAVVSEPIDITFIGKLLSDGGEARAVFRERGSVIGRMRASLRPLGPGAGSWVTRMMEAPLGGGIRYNGPASALFSLAGQPGQTLSGPLGVAADFSCRVSDPCLSGVVRGKSLVYENTTYGTRVSDIDLAARFDGNRLQVERLTGAAGEGTVTASGYIGLASDAGYPMDLAIQMDQARLARSDALAATATGQLRLTKSAAQTALLSGQIRLPETRYEIVRQGSAEIPQLTGVRFKPPKGRQRITGEEPAEPITSVLQLVRLDIDVSAPERLYVSGMGLESEWSADFNVSGTSQAPRMAGNVRLIRGTLGFAGKSFELTEGRIGFTGGREINPTLALVASEDIEDVLVRVNIGGRAYDPQITFSSVPGLPQDEIVARILFGSSIANLSAIQAVQLASSLNSLRGSGGGLNPLGKLRSATGIDRLRILGPDEQSGRGTALAAGQYLTDDIYVELITDTRGFTATQLEVSVLPWLSVLSQAGGSGVTNASVRVRKNY